MLDGTAYLEKFEKETPDYKAHKALEYPGTRLLSVVVIPLVRALVATMCDRAGYKKSPPRLEAFQMLGASSLPLFRLKHEMRRLAMFVYADKESQGLEGGSGAFLKKQTTDE